MVTIGRKCSECSSEMLIDRVVEQGDTKTYYYTCVNPKCSEYGKAFTTTGEESESTIKE